MVPRERVLAALDGEEPDRVPRALSFYHVDLARVVPPGLVLGGEPVDVQFVEFPVTREERDLVRRALPFEADTRLGRPDQVETYDRWRYSPAQPDRRNPLARATSLSDLEHFPFPEAGRSSAVRDLGRQVRRLRVRGLAVGGNLPHLGGELFEAAWRLRGLESFLMDLVERPDWADLLLDRLTALAVHNARSLAQADVDLLALDDDVGMPGSMIIGPDTWRRFFKPRMAKVIASARAIKPGLRVLYHSDGWFEPILEDLLEIGVNAINPLQPEHMDAARIRRRFGSRLALWGAVGRQTTFATAAPDVIRSEVRERVETLGRAGLILCPAYDIDEPDIPSENVAAFLEAAAAFG